MPLASLLTSPCLLQHILALLASYAAALQYSASLKLGVGIVRFQILQ
jgi:hypothetical protein